MTLTEFLLARFAEDEEFAKSAALEAGDVGFGNERRDSGKVWGASYHEVHRRKVREEQSTRRMILEGRPLGLDVARHVARHDPARVLAECEAKRRIVKDLSQVPINDFSPEMHPQAQWAAARTLRHLALPYADHSDYREEWKP